MNRPDSSQRETIAILIIWSVMCLWVMCSSYFLGYVNNKTEVEILLGMPRWVTLSVALPWLVSTIVSIWFAFGYMKDDASEERS